MSTDPVADRAQRRRGPIRIQADVIHALLLRELQTRFGGFRLGYLWAILEPGLYIFVLAIFRDFLGRGAPSGVEFPLFLLTGIVPWLFFTHSVTRNMDAVRANRSLFQYRYVTPFSTVFARILLEGMIMSLVYVILIGIFTWVGFDTRVADPLALTLILLLFFCFTLGASLIAMVIGTFAPDVAKAMRIPMRLLFFISGVIFSIERLPAEVHPYLTWNPILHFMELMRQAYFDVFETSVADSSFIISSTLAILWLGLLMYSALRPRLLLVMSK